MYVDLYSTDDIFSGMHLNALANAYSCVVMMYVQPYLCRIAEAAGTCPVCRRNMKKVRKIFTV